MTRRGLFLIFTLVLLAGCTTTPLPEPAGNTDEPTVTSLSGCYTAAVGDDRAYLEITEVDSAIRGTMEYAFAQKDSMWGLVLGSATDEAVDLEYQFISEGILSTRSLTLTRSDEGLSGEGFTYERSDTCGRGPNWTDADVTDVVADTINDPENGYFARVRYRISTTGGYDYRCIATVTDDADTTIAEWVGFGTVDAAGAKKARDMRTNIRPEQVDKVAKASVSCQIRTTR